MTTTTISHRNSIATACAAAAAVALLISAVDAQTTKPGPEVGGFGGTWFDDTGDGAVELAPCAGRLCGRIVWLKSQSTAGGQPLTDGNNPDPKRRGRRICGLDVIGDLKRQRNGNWDEGWIYDPKDGKSYDVELKLRGSDQLVVTGYLGIKLLSESFVWKRAPAGLERCAADLKRL